MKAELAFSPKEKRYFLIVFLYSSAILALPHSELMMIAQLPAIWEYPDSFVMEKGDEVAGADSLCGQQDAF